MKAEKSQKLLT